MIAALPTLAEQVRNAAACAAQARAEKARAMVGPGVSGRVAQANALRLAALRLMAADADITTRQLYLRLHADMKVGEGAVHHVVYDLRDRGWAVSCIRVGPGRVNSWRITSVGRAALEDLEAARTQTTASTPATTGEH